MPAASSEPKVSTRTRTATRDADELGGADRDAGGAEGVAADGDLEAGVLGGRGGLLERVEARRRRARSRGTSYWTVARAARPSGLIAWLANGLTTAATCGRLPGRGDDLLDRRRRTAGSATVGAVGGDEDDLRARRRPAPGEAASRLVERLLRLRAGDRELVVERAAER